MANTYANVNLGYLPETGENRWADDIADGARVGLTLNGAPFNPQTRVALFPGVYQLEVSNPLVTLTGGRFTIPIPDDPRDRFGRLPPNDTSIVLTQNAQQQIGAIAQTTMEQCLTEHALDTSCGLRDMSSVGRLLGVPDHPRLGRSNPPDWT